MFASAASEPLTKTQDFSEARFEAFKSGTGSIFLANQKASQIIESVSETTTTVNNYYWVQLVLSKSAERWRDLLLAPEIRAFEEE